MVAVHIPNLSKWLSLDKIRKEKEKKKTHLCLKSRDWLLSSFVWVDIKSLLMLMHVIAIDPWRGEHIVHLANIIEIKIKNIIVK